MLATALTAKATRLLEILSATRAPALFSDLLAATHAPAAGTNRRLVEDPVVLRALRRAVEEGLAEDMFTERRRDPYGLRAAPRTMDEVR